MKRSIFGKHISAKHLLFLLLFPLMLTNSGTLWAASATFCNNTTTPPSGAVTLNFADPGVNWASNVYAQTFNN